MHHHFEEREGRNAHILEVDRVVLPGLGVLEGFLLIGVIGIEAIAVRVYQFDGVLELYRELEWT